MRLFNAFQLVLLFAASPFLITYTMGAEFYAHAVLGWVFIAAYLVGFFCLINVVADSLKD